MKLNVIIAVICLTIGALLAIKFKKPSEVIVEKEKLVNQVQTKVVTRIVEKPTGEKETIIESNSVSNTETSKSSKTIVDKPKYHVNLNANAPVDKLSERTYSISVQKYLIDGISAGVSYSTDNTIGISVGISF